MLEDSISELGAEYDKSAATLFIFFTGSSSLGLLLYAAYLCYMPSDETVLEMKEDTIPSPVRYRITKNIENANLFLIMSYICVYYSISISLTLFNKWFLNSWEGMYQSTS